MKSIIIKDSNGYILIKIKRIKEGFEVIKAPCVIDGLKVTIIYDKNKRHSMGI